jgi:hypothetical protein
MKPAGRMPVTLALRFAGCKAPPSPEVEAGSFLPSEDARVKLLLQNICMKLNYMVQFSRNKVPPPLKFPAY